MTRLGRMELLVALARSFRRIAAAAALSLLAVVPASAQVTVPKWDIEGHFGGSVTGDNPAGTALLPSAAGTFTTVTGFPTARVSSWYFGDGARLLSDVSAGLGLAGPITPLDPVLGTGVGNRNATTFGVRVGRALTGRFRAEFTFDYFDRAVGFDGATSDAIEATRGTIETKWRSLLGSTGPSSVSSSVSSARLEGGGGQIMALGVVNINLRALQVSDLLPLPRRFMPFVTAGAGVLSSIDDPLHVAIDGVYQLTLPNLVHFSEADSVSVEYSTPRHAIVAAFGGGFTYDLTPRMGIRSDVRLHLSPNRVTVNLSTSPLVVNQSPTGYIASQTSPSLQLSNDAALGVDSSLSGPPIADFETYRSSGVNRRLTMTGGVFFRF
jgi:hypothetical protein